MNFQINGETHVEKLTDVCQNVCKFIKTITVDNMTKDEKISSYETKINDLQVLCSDLKFQLEKINEHVKTLASFFNFKTNQDDSAINTLAQWVLCLSEKNVVDVKKRKIYSSYSPLKLSLKDKTQVNDGTINKSRHTQFEKENKSSSQNETKNIWKLQIKRDGNPSDLLNKSKQTILKLGSQEDKFKLDITTISPMPKTSVCNSTSIFNPKLFNAEKNNESTHLHANDLIHNTQMDDSCNISLSHFNQIIKPKKNIKLNKSNTSGNQIKTSDKSSCEETTCITENVSNNTELLEKQSKFPDKELDSYDIIPGLNDKKNTLPNYKFKEDPVRKHNERKLLNGWDCEECCKFYAANNDNPVDAKTAMNHFSRHRSVKHQNHASTPPGFWDPI